jgi:hypothetical protein
VNGFQVFLTPIGSTIRMYWFYGTTSTFTVTARNSADTANADTDFSIIVVLGV